VGFSSLHGDSAATRTRDLLLRRQLRKLLSSLLNNNLHFYFLSLNYNLFINSPNRQSAGIVTAPVPQPSRTD